MEYSQELDKFGIVGKSRPSAILQWQLLGEKNKLKLKKNEDQNFPFFIIYIYIFFFCKIAADCNFYRRKTSIFSDHGNVVLISIYERVRVHVTGKNQRF